MPRGEARVGQRLRDAVADALGGRRQPHAVQFGGDVAGLLRAGLQRLLGMNGLEHRGHLGALGLGDLREHVAVEVHRAALVGGSREHLGDGAGHGGGLVAGEHAHAREPPALEPREELPPALGRLREPLRGADDLAVAVVVDADGHHHGHVLEGAAPGPLQVDPVDEDIGIGAGERPAAPFLDGLERLLVEVRDRRCRHARAPEDLGYVLDPPGGDAGQVHLDHGLLDGGLAPLVALDDRRCEPHALELRHLERDLAGRGGEVPLVVAGAVRLPACRPLVAALTRSSASSSRSALMVSSTVLLTSSLSSPRTAFSSNVTMGSDMVPPPNMIESRQLNHTEGRDHVFLYLDYAAVKVRKRLYVTLVFYLLYLSALYSK